MYTISISTYSGSQTFEFSNLRDALNSFVERCDALGYDYTENENGTFTAGGYGHSHELQLTSNF